MGGWGTGMARPHEYFNTWPHRVAAKATEFRVVPKARTARDRNRDLLLMEMDEALVPAGRSK